MSALSAFLSNFVSMSALSAFSSNFPIFVIASLYFLFASSCFLENSSKASPTPLIAPLFPLISFVFLLTCSFRFSISVLLLIFGSAGPLSANETPPVIAKIVSAAIVKLTFFLNKDLKFFSRFNFIINLLPL